ncbi:hypothetical protein ACSBR2_009047 [Camellia fascicularis]
MSISFEALAMSGANYLEFGMDVEEWERLDSVLPPHLYAEDEDKEEEREEDEGPRKRENLVHDFKDKKLTAHHHVKKLVVLQMEMVMTITAAMMME